MTTKDIRFWLEDKELKTPEHDEMVLWTFNNSKTILKELNLFPEEKINFWKGYNSNSGKWNWEKEEFEIEEPFSSYEEKTKEKIEEEYQRFKKIEESPLEISEKKIIEYALGGNYNIGFIDLALFLNVESRETEHFSKSAKTKEGYFFEIKPEIKSIGEIMRQINYYRKYLEKNICFILITKTKGLKEIFESQNVYVYEYTKGQQTL